MTWASRVDERMDEFAQAWREGEADPARFLADLDVEEGRELAVRMELFLDRLGPAPWDPGKYQGSLSEQVVEGSLGDMAEAGQADLIRMRVERGLGKQQVANDLADDLGADSAGDREKISEYYHRLEWGNLTPGAISRRVIDSIAAILGSDRQSVIDAISGPGDARSEVFARYSAGPPAEGQRSPGSPTESMKSPSASPHDWVDELFLSQGEERD